MFTSTRIVAAAAIVALLGSVVYLGAPSPVVTETSGTPTSEVKSSPVVWSSGLVALNASAMRIQEGDKVFSGAFTGDSEGVSRWDARSDPGDASYRTLEVEWVEQDLEQRLILYLEADETDWWVSQIRTYDGYPDADWITYPGPFFKTPVGESFRGDAHLTSPYGRVPGELEFDGLILTPRFVLVFGGPDAVTGSNEGEPIVEPMDSTEVVVVSPEPEATAAP